MMTNNFALYSAKILAEIARDIVYFPLWWHSRGLALCVKKLLVFLRNREKSLALLIWIKNIHRPMYGQHDWQGMLISFLVRIAQTITRSIIMLFWIAIAIAAICAWIIFPFFVIYKIIFQLNA